MGRHVTFYDRPAVYRRSRCLLGNGRPKWKFETEAEANGVGSTWPDKGRGVVESYQCPECSRWHLGRPRTPWRPLRVVHREPALLAELDERAAVQLLMESHGPVNHKLREVHRRFAAALRRARNDYAGAHDEGH